MPAAASAPEPAASVKAAPEPESITTEEDSETMLEDPPESADELPEGEAEEEAEPEAKPGKVSQTRLRAGKTRGDRTEKAIRPAEREKTSGRVSTTSSRLRKRGKEAEKDAEGDKKALEGVADVVGKSSRRGSVSRTSMRSKEPAKPFLTTKMKILLGAGLLLVVAGAIAWNPVRKKMLISAIEQGDANAAKTLWHWRQGEALEVFAAHIKGAPANVRDAALAGLAEAVKDGNKGALDVASGVLRDGSEEEKLGTVKTLVPVAEYFVEKRGTKGLGETMAKNMADLVPVLLPAAKKEEPSQAVRVAAIEGLGKLPAPGGGCALLLAIAKAEQGPTREAALRGVEMSAVPDAVGELLKHMADPEDKALAGVARAGFSKVRDQAPTAALTPLLDDKSDEVRLEITKALATRKGDQGASKGIAKALGDGSAAVRLEAVRAVPVMALSPEDLGKLNARISDDSEDVRVATAETISALRDEVTWKLLLQSFEKGLEGKTLQAFIKTLGFRGNEKNKKAQRKDMAAIAIVMQSMEKNPGAASSIGEALALLTAARGKEAREASRRQWTLEQWKAWYENVKKRDELEKAAMDSLKAADKEKGNFDKYPAAQKMVEEALVKLETCQTMCSPNDPEDEWIFKGAIEKLTPLLYEFRKNQHLDLGR